MSWGSKVLYIVSWFFAISGSLVLVAVVLATNSGLIRWSLP